MDFRMEEIRFIFEVFRNILINVNLDYERE